MRVRGSTVVEYGRGAVSPTGSPARDVLRHQPNDIGARNVAAQKYADTLSVPQDRDPIGQANDLGKTMRDIEHRFSFRSKLHHPFDQKLGVRFRQNRGRLIEHHDFAGMDERPRDLRQPQVRNAEGWKFWCPGRSSRRPWPVRLGQFVSPRRSSGRVSPSRLRHPNRIFRPMENSGTISMSCGTTVMPSRDASLGLVTATTFPADEEITLVGRVHAAQNLNQRGLASAILSDQGVDLAAVQIKVHAVERRHARKTLCDSLQSQSQRPGFSRRSHKCTSV